MGKQIMIDSVWKYDCSNKININGVWKSPTATSAMINSVWKGIPDESTMDFNRLVNDGWIHISPPLTGTNSLNVSDHGIILTVNNAQTTGTMAGIELYQNATDGFPCRQYTTMNISGSIRFTIITNPTANNSMDLYWSYGITGKALRSTAISVDHDYTFSNSAYDLTQHSYSGNRCGIYPYCYWISNPPYSDPVIGSVSYVLTINSLSFS